MNWRGPIVHTTFWLLALTWCFLVWTGVLMLIGGCAGGPGKGHPPGPIAGAQPTTIEDALEPSLSSQLRALLAIEPPLYGAVRELPLSSACAPRRPTPLPFIVPQTGVPRVGRVWQCRFLTTAMAPFPDDEMWLVMSTSPPAAGLPTELSPVGMAGCQLAVNPQLLVHIPRHGAPGEGSMILTRERGQGSALLRWTPQPGSAGMRLWLQLMVATPASPAGYLLSGAYELTVGS